MSDTECDVIVVGLGPGGEHVALKLGQAGLRVLGVEERLVGGECPYFGCVPSKMMIAAAHTLREAGRVNTLAGSSTVSPDWTPVATRIRDEATDDWNDAVAVKRLEDSGATFVRGRGVLAGDGQVMLTGSPRVYPTNVPATRVPITAQAIAVDPHGRVYFLDNAGAVREVVR